ncbi:MAG: DUF4011 domain-containing protein [Firmicutes bacterium]|nr:DUF4011 domain-containing protein [Bacillota bacterium]
MDANFEKWCERLLDAGKSNKLVNYKDSKLRNIDVVVPDLKKVFDKIKNGSRLAFFDVDKFIKEKTKELEKESKKQIDEEESEVLALSKTFVVDEVSPMLRQAEILAYKKGVSLRKILGTLRKLARDSLDEKGLNILYMAFGFLRWRESNDSNVWYNSPLVLIPVRIDNASANEPFFVSEYEDEISSNPTLLYKMKTDFGVSIPLFEEENFENKNIIEYFSKVEEQIKSTGWTIIQDVAIGTFSFHKMNMYNDLKVNEELILQNRNVVRLMNKESCWAEVQEEELSMDEFFKKNKDVHLHNVVDADSSQVEAIVKAKSGNNMVIQGPPGTGKSQTITNLIAEFLHDGKKILFVSEKLAALSVVHKNLERVGLADFCLELHSNKTNKKAVLAELHRTLNLGRIQLDERVEEEVASLLRSKFQLDRYAEVLHTRREVINRTPYEILGAISKFHNMPDFEFVISDIANRGSTYLFDVMDAISDYRQSLDVIGRDFRRNSWFGYINKDTSFNAKISLKKLLGEAVEYVSQLNELCEDLNKRYSLDVSSFVDLEKSIELLRTIKNLKFFDQSIFDKRKLVKIVELLPGLVELEKTMQKACNAITKNFVKEFYDIDLVAMQRRFKLNYGGLLRGFNAGYKQDMNLLKSLRVGREVKLNYKTAYALVSLGVDYINSQRELADFEKQIFKVINKENFVAFGNERSWEKVQSEIVKLDTIMEKDLLFFKNISKDKFDVIKEDLATRIDIFKKIKLNRSCAISLQENFDKEVVCFDTKALDELLFKLSTCLEDFDKLDFWLKFIKTVEGFKEFEIYEFMIKAIDRNIEPGNLDKVFKKMFYTQWFLHLVSEDEVLCNFNRGSHDKAVDTFKAKDKLKFKIARAQIVSKLSAQRPSPQLASGGGQVNTLQREALKSRRQMPVRMLLGTIPELVQNLKPCFMMSPLSVSTFLDDAKIKFDVVIFDEASQIFPWDALGSIYRANQIIVAGDSRQMPPSNFFSAGVNDEEDDDDFDDSSLDFESILDLCEATFEQKHLRWHYRSRIEDLIAFSNKNFYENNLITFPSNQSGDNDGVQFFYVKDGMFDRKSKNNIKEAEQVVDLVYNHFDTCPERSLGVVAFSVSQQEAIESLLGKRREGNDKFAKFFDEKRNERFFVKNLETIQGDERDAIIFSVGYAKDNAGRFIHNFGPLNRQGGERRLNVAVTRAKFNVKLVASIRTYDIDLSKTAAEGSRLLKEYLDFAENGRQVLVKDGEQHKAIAMDSEFEVEVYDTLVNAGYKVDTQVGCSGFRIDLAVRHSDLDVHVLAIECDGANYHSSVSTRDRDRLRQEVLERQGWKFYRIWSTDWFRNNRIEKQRLLDMVERSIKNFDRKNKSDEDFVSTKIKSMDENEEEQEFTSRQLEKDIKEHFPVYVEADTLAIQQKHTHDYRFNFDAFIAEVVKIEQPITEELLLRRILHVFEREKITSTVRLEFASRMKSNRTVKKFFDFYAVDANIPIRLRVPNNGVGVRDIAMICREELTSGLGQIIKLNVGISKDGLFRALINLLGFSRTGVNITAILDDALDFLLKRREVKRKGELYFMAD